MIQRLKYTGLIRNPAKEQGHILTMNGQKIKNPEPVLIQMRFLPMKNRQRKSRQFLARLLQMIIPNLFRKGNAA